MKYYKSQKLKVFTLGILNHQLVLLHTRLLMELWRECGE